MNRFRTKKKVKAAEEGGRSSHESEAPTLKPMKTFRRKKGIPEPEPRLELDLANALPPSDDFRTSLLMTGLSARFSMLREQDDPKSKIGKASDDSVLFPKRQSRLNDFGFNPRSLADIAEVSSINGSIRPPFATSNRMDSFASDDGYGTDTGGSIMARAKPGEGNNLFGGRQKIYKIPTAGSASMRSLNGGEMGGMGGRALYDDDVSQSAFQKLRQREREEREQRELEQQQSYAEQAEQPSILRSDSPPLSGYNRNRETSSTTSSGPYGTRMSTAATSVTSQRTPSVNGYSTPSTPAVPNQNNGISLDRSTTKNKRLYETGLDQNLPQQQFFSAANRLENLTRVRNMGTRSPSPSPGSPDGTTFDISQQFDNSSRHLRYQPTQLQTQVGAFESGAKISAKDALKPYGINPPLSPPVSEGDDKSALSIQPNDKGKATALGTFSKPTQPYDERKYAQRQMLLQQGRETPPLRKHSPPEAFLPNQPAIRTRAESNSTYSSSRSRSSSSVQREFIPRDRNFFKEPAVSENGLETSGTFLNSPNDSTVSSPRSSEHENEKQLGQINSLRDLPASVSSTMHSERPLESDHPAFRRSPPAWDETNTEAEKSGPPSILVSNVAKDGGNPSPEQFDRPEDSPTLPPPNGLSGIIRQHLRSESNASSVGAASSPGLTSNFPAFEDEPAAEYGVKGNPWAGNDWFNDNMENDNDNAPVPQSKADFRQHTIPPPASPMGSRGGQTITDESPKQSPDKDISSHSRYGSSESQIERDDFATELANRRKHVQEKMKSFVESDSRSQSPVRTPDLSSDSQGLKNGHLNFLKQKSSRGSLVMRPKDSQSKAMKMLGISGSQMSNTPPANIKRLDDNHWKHEEEEMMHGLPKSPRPSPENKASQMRHARRDAQRERERQVLSRRKQNGLFDASESDEFAQRPREKIRRPTHGGQDGNPAMLGSRQRSPSVDRGIGVPPRHDPILGTHHAHAPSSKEESRPASRATRDRSSSDASTGRSKSHGRYRDDRAKPMVDGLNAPPQGVRSMRTSPALPASPFVPSARSRSNSRTGPNGHGNSHQLQPVQIAPVGDAVISPRPSPVAPFSVNSTPALIQSSPAGSQATTPTTQAFQSQGRIPTNRKKSVNKSDISDPIFLSSTSRITTVNLPNNISVPNGPPPSTAPPLPPMDPRRRQTRTQQMLGAWKSKGYEPSPTPVVPVYGSASTEDMSTFSADEADHNQPKVRRKLRKISSEGGNLNVRAQQAFATTPSPAVPAFPAGAGGMF
jgi:hypothetical protein